MQTKKASWLVGSWGENSSQPEVGVPLRSGVQPPGNASRGHLCQDGSASRRRWGQQGSASSNPACGRWTGSNEFCPGPGPSSLGGRLGVGAGVLPRNFLGGLSRSPAAGSTTQRSSTNLGDKIAQSVGEKGPSPQASLPRGRGFRASERPPKNPSPSLSTPPNPSSLSLSWHHC